MALTIDDPEADRLARSLAETQGLSVQDAVLAALRRAHRETRQNVGSGIAKQKASDQAVQELVRQIQGLPILDERSDDEILRYDDRGLPSP